MSSTTYCVRSLLKVQGAGFRGIYWQKCNTEASYRRTKHWLGFRPSSAVGEGEAKCFQLVSIWFQG